MALGKLSQLPSKPRQITLRPPRFGVIAFQNPQAPTSGAACVAGGRPQMFGGRTELASDVLWISNAPKGDYAQNFRAPGFLRVSTPNIAGDLGVSLTDLVEGLPSVAQTVGRVRDILVHAYPWYDLSLDWDSSGGRKTMSDCIAQLLPPLGEIPPALESPLRQACQTYSSVPDGGLRPYDDGPRSIYTLRMNRLTYANYLCQQMFPTNSWLAVADAQHQGATLDQLLDPDFPSLVEASVEFSGDTGPYSVSQLAAVGSTSSASKTTVRRWFSQPELAWLVEHANVHVLSAYVSQGARPLDPMHRLPEILMADPVYALSLSAGIVAEMHWDALAKGSSVRRAYPGATFKYVQQLTSTAVWLRAFDRAYSFQMAKAVADRGYDVSGYGYGAVSFWGPKNDLQPIIDLSDELGATYPNLAAIRERMLIGGSMELVS